MYNRHMLCGQGNQKEGAYEVLKKNQYGQYLKDVLDGKYQENLY